MLRCGGVPTARSLTFSAGWTCPLLLAFAFSLLCPAGSGRVGRDHDHVALSALQFLLLGACDRGGVQMVCTKWGHEIQCHVRTQVLHTDDGDTEGCIYAITPM